MAEQLIYNHILRRAFKHNASGEFIHPENQGGQFDAPTGHWTKFLLASKEEVEAFFGSLPTDSWVLENITLKMYVDFQFGTYVFIEADGTESLAFYDAEAEADAEIAKYAAQYDGWLKGNPQWNPEDPITLECECGEGFEASRDGILAAAYHSCTDPYGDKPGEAILSVASFSLKPASEVF